MSGCGYQRPHPSSISWKRQKTEKPTASPRFTHFRFQIVIADRDLRLGQLSRAEVVQFWRAPKACCSRQHPPPNPGPRGAQNNALRRCHQGSQYNCERQGQCNGRKTSDGNIKQHEGCKQRETESGHSPREHTGEEPSRRPLRLRRSGHGHILRPGCPQGQRILPEPDVLTRAAERYH